MALPYVITVGPVATPSIHGLDASAERVTDGDGRWVNGFQWVPDGCGGVSSLAPLCDQPEDDWSDPVTEPASCVVVQPFMLELLTDRTTFTADITDYRARTLRLFENGWAWALEREFWTGAINSGTQHLASTGAVVLNSVANPITGVSPGRALSLLEGALGDCGGGRRGTIHAPADVASMWTYAGAAIKEDGKRLATVAKGNIVVAGSGYPGTGPVGKTAATPTGNLAWVFATGGQLQLRLTEPEVDPPPSEKERDAFNRGNNSFAYRAFRYAAVTFDPCCGPFAVLVDLGS